MQWINPKSKLCWEGKWTQKTKRLWWKVTGCSYFISSAFGWLPGSLLLVSSSKTLAVSVFVVKGFTWTLELPPYECKDRPPPLPTAYSGCLCLCWKQNASMWLCFYIGYIGYSFYIGCWDYVWRSFSHRVCKYSMGMYVSPWKHFGA